MSGDLHALHELAHAMGVLTEYWDGLKRHVAVGPETLVRTCQALGAELTGPDDAERALWLWRESQAARLVPPVVVAWQGVLPTISVPANGHLHAELRLEHGEMAMVDQDEGALRFTANLPFGYHRLTVEGHGRRDHCTIISAPMRAYRRAGTLHSWGVGTQLAALRTERSRSVADLRDLEMACEWIASHGGDLLTVLPVLPTFNHVDPEPSPYSPVSRLYWSELMLDLGTAHRAVGAVTTLDVQRADAEVRAALAGIEPAAETVRDDDLMHYAMFRGAQAKYGRNWRDWPEPARSGVLAGADVQADEVRFHLVAQERARVQLKVLRERLDARGFRLGLDLAVGVHPDGYDTWSRQHLFAGGMSVGAPPDGGFPSGQDWGFAPVLPTASREEGHHYVISSIGHQMALAGVLRVDHIMAWSRLYWIPHGMRLDQGTYVRYPADELFAILTLESHRHRCEVVGENLGTVPLEIFEALPKHDIWGMYLAQFEAMTDQPTLSAPTAADVAMIGTHDTPTLAGWMAGDDIGERVALGLLAASAEAATREERATAVARLAEHLGVAADDPRAMLHALLDWLGRSPSPLVIPWIEDLWLERGGVNIPGTSTQVRKNWQRPMCATLDVLMQDQSVAEALQVIRDRRSEIRAA